jgi:hypothetical protein
MEMAMVTWEKLQIQVIHDPKTGAAGPWEVWGIFPERRVHWGSFKTEAAAELSAEQSRKKYRAKYGDGVQ